MPFKKKPITPQPVKTEEPKVVTPPVITENKPVVKDVKVPATAEPVKKTEYDFATFPIQAISAQLGLPLTERIDPKSASLWKSYLADGWKPVTFSIYERENKLVVMFVR